MTFFTAVVIFERLATPANNLGEAGTRSRRPYHQLGTIAQERRDFTSAEQWYRKSLAIEKQGDEHGAGGHLSPTGEDRPGAADIGVRSSGAARPGDLEKQGDEHVCGSNYHYLGMIAQEQGDFASAEQWYRKALAIEEKQGDEHGPAITYHQLGTIAEEQRDFAGAEQWYRNAGDLGEVW